MPKKLLTFFLFSIVISTAIGQGTKPDIQRKQQQLQKEIAELNKNLNEIKSSKKHSLVELALVQRKIDARRELINSITKDLRRLDDTIYLSQLEINRMERELATLKLNYANSLVLGYRNRGNYDYLHFIFSATTFNEAIKRAMYIKSYRQYREARAAVIMRAEDALQQKIAAIASTKTEKSTALSEQHMQLNVLRRDKLEQSKVVASLNGKEQEIGKQIKSNEKSQQKLMSALATVIDRETKKAEAETKPGDFDQQKKGETARLSNNNKIATNSDIHSNDVASNSGNRNAMKKDNRTYSALESTAAGLTESLNFEISRGKLPWPVSSGTVTIHFGPNQLTKNLKFNSDGITISLPTGTPVKSVADGEVSAVVDIGGQQTVFVRHGKYFTAYSNLNAIKVSKGSQVNAGSVLGSAGTGGDGDGEVVFMVSNSNGYLNPESWLRSR